MATRKRRRRAAARKRPDTQPSPPPPAQLARQPGLLEQKLLGAFERVLDVAAEDPERVVRMGEAFVDGLGKAARFFQDNPEAAKRAVRDTIISNVAKVAKKKLREK